MTSVDSKAHEHKLIHSGQNLEWICDACGRTSNELQQTHSYNCSSCSFDLCESCTKPTETSKHTHSVEVTNVGKIYPDGAWKCDNCGATSTSQGRLTWHCENGCYFDLCFGCTRSYKSTAHRHLLLKSNPKESYPSMQGWVCDICCKEFKHEDEEKPYECKNCQYDLCQSCMKETEVDEFENEDVEEVETKMEKDPAIY